MKRMMTLALVLAVLASVCAMIPAAQADGQRYYVYTSNGKPLNLRAEPSKESEILLKIPYGDEFWVFETLGNGWAYGHWGGQFGYVMTRFLTKSQPGPEPKPGEKVETKEDTERRQEEQKLANELANEHEVTPFYVAVVATRTTGWINFRVGPSKITARIASFPDGKELIVQGETINWYKAVDPDTNNLGYINKNFTTVLTKAVSTAVEEQTGGTQNLGKLDVNGEFDLTCRLPEGYTLQTVNMRGDKIVASLLSEDMTKPEMYLTVAYDETYGEVERMNDMTDEELAVLERTFTEMDQVEILYRETGYGTKVLVARENGSDTDFIDILAIYKGYFIEFKMMPSASVADQTLTDAQLQTCIDFLTDVDFNPVEKAQ